MSEKNEKNATDKAIIKAARKQLIKAIAIQSAGTIATAALTAATMHYVGKALNANSEPMKVYVTNETPSV